MNFVHLFLILNAIVAFNLKPLMTSVGTLFHRIPNPRTPPIGQLIDTPIMNSPMALAAKSGTSGITDLFTLEANSFLMAAVKNTDESFPIMKSIAKGATETALDNPVLVLKVVATHLVPKLFKTIVTKISAMLKTINKMRVAVPKIPRSLFTEKRLSSSAHKELLDNVFKGLEQVSKNVEAINLAIMMQINLVSIMAASKNTMVLDQARKVGSRMMMDTLTNPKSLDDSATIAFQNELRKKYPLAMKKLDDAKLEGAIEALVERIMKSQLLFIMHVGKLGMGILIKRQLRFKRDFDLNEFKQLTIETIKEFEMIASMIKKMST